MKKIIKIILFSDNFLNDIFIELLEARYNKMSYEIDYINKRVIFTYE